VHAQMHVHLREGGRVARSDLAVQLDRRSAGREQPQWQPRWRSKRERGLLLTQEAATAHSNTE